MFCLTGKRILTTCMSPVQPANLRALYRHSLVIFLPPYINAQELSGTYALCGWPLFSISQQQLAVVFFLLLSSSLLHCRLVAFHRCLPSFALRFVSFSFACCWLLLRPCMSRVRNSLARKKRRATFCCCSFVAITGQWSKAPDVQTPFSSSLLLWRPSLRHHFSALFLPS